MNRHNVGAWASTTHPHMPAAFLAVAFFSGRLVSRSGGSMRESFALCEAFGLTPFPSPWIPPFQDAARSAREGLSAGTGRPGRRHSRPWRRGPPLPALRCAQRSASVATGGCARAGGGGGGRPRPFGMLPWRGREAARRDHQLQLVRELITRDTSRVMNRPLARRRERHMRIPLRDQGFSITLLERPRERLADRQPRTWTAARRILRTAAILAAVPLSLGWVGEVGEACRLR